MMHSAFRFLFCLLAAIGLLVSTSDAAPVPLGSSWSVNAGGVGFAQLSGESASGYSVVIDDGSGTVPSGESTRPRIFQSFSTAQDLSAVGSSLKLTFDIIFDSDTDNDSQDFRFGFYSNDGEGVSIGPAIDLGVPGGSTTMEFFGDPDLDTAVTAPTVPSLDNGFNNSSSSTPGNARYNQVGTTLTDVGFDDQTDTHRLMYTLTRTASGYDAALTWENITQGTSAIGTSGAISTATQSTSSDSAVAGLINAATSWDGLGVFINADGHDSGNDTPYAYTISNLSVEATIVPEPTSLALLLCSVTLVGIGQRRHR